MMTPKQHSAYWRDLAQRRLARISNLRGALTMCQKLATVRNQPRGDGHFGIAAVARCALKQDK